VFLNKSPAKGRPRPAAAVPACPMPADTAAVNTKLRGGVQNLMEWANGEER